MLIIFHSIILDIVHDTHDIVHDTFLVVLDAIILIVEKIVNNLGRIFVCEQYFVQTAKIKNLAHHADNVAGERDHSCGLNSLVSKASISNTYIFNGDINTFTFQFFYIIELFTMLHFFDSSAIYIIAIV